MINCNDPVPNRSKQAIDKPFDFDCKIFKRFPSLCLEKKKKGK